MARSMALALAETTPALEAWLPSDLAAGLPYVELGDLASTVSAFDRRAPHDWSKLFAEMERQIVEDPERRELLAVGFLETLQNVELNKGRDLARWEPLLGPQTLAAWRDVIDYWASGPRGSRDLAHAD
jgi:hypothetical protein